jgi:hypothetical protein
MQRLRAALRSLDQRTRIARWHSRAALVLWFAWLGWRLGAARERLENRRAALVRALGR